MKDFFGKELEVGDEVAFISTNYQSFMLGKITNISKVKVTIEYNYGTPTDSYKRLYKTYRFPNTLIKKEK